MSDVFIIAIDGPAASGKGTLGRRLAQQTGLPHYDTGLSYRAVGQALLLAGQPLDDEALAVAAARAIDFAAFDRDVLSDHAIGNAASKIAAMPGVRRTLVLKQHELAHTAPGAVMDGRDIGTVVCPDAQVKLYVTASPRERARRRWNEMQLKGQDADFDAILVDIEQRDARDMGRADSPLKPADDAHLLDTSQMDIETAFQKALSIVKQAKTL